jgi:transposase InsO family protein
MKAMKTKRIKQKKKSVKSKTRKESLLQMKLKNEYYDPSNVAALSGVDKLTTLHKSNKLAVEKWLPTQNAYSLHKPLRKKFPTRSYRTSGLNQLWQMDLMEMIPYARINKGYKYILTCIDVFSRFARAQPLKTKSGPEVKEAIVKMLEGQSIPRYIQTDLGKEFYNSHVQKLFKKHGIKHYSVNSQFKAALVERFNRTLREKLTRYFTYKGNKIWYTVLPIIVDTYNRSKHRGIFHIRPIDVTEKNEVELWELQEDQMNKKGSKTLLPLNNFVRISKLVNSPFKKNFEENWSDEVFRIIKTDRSAAPTMYVLEDLNKNVIVGKFYKEELQDIGKNPPLEMRIEKVIRSKMVGKHKQYLVKWVGYDNSFNSWINSSSLVKNE